MFNIVTPLVVIRTDTQKVQATVELSAPAEGCGFLGYYAEHFSTVKLDATFYVGAAAGMTASSPGAVRIWR